MGPKKGKGKTPVDGVDTTAMSREQLEAYSLRLREELDREREERNFFQLERDKLRTFWEITRQQLEESRSQLRNQDRAIDELEEKHQAEIKVYKQKVKHLLYEHQCNLSELKVEGMVSLKQAQDDYNAMEQQLLKDKKNLKEQMHSLELAHLEEIRQLKIDHSAELSKLREQLESDAAELEKKYEARLISQAEEQAVREQMETAELETRKNQHIVDLTKQHEAAFQEMKNYYNDITLNNLALISSLKEQMEELKSNHDRMEKSLTGVQAENKKLVEPLKLAQSELTVLRRQLAAYEQDKVTLANTKQRLSLVTKELEDLRWENDVLELRFEKVEKERDRLHAEFVGAVLDVQQKTGLKGALLEKRMAGVKQGVSGHNRSDPFSDGGGRGNRTLNSPLQSSGEAGCFQVSPCVPHMCNVKCDREVCAGNVLHRSARRAITSVGERVSHPTRSRPATAPPQDFSRATCQLDDLPSPRIRFAPRRDIRERAKELAGLNHDNAAIGRRQQQLNGIGRQRARSCSQTAGRRWKTMAKCSDETNTACRLPLCSGGRAEEPIQDTDPNNSWTVLVRQLFRENRSGSSSISHENIDESVNEERNRLPYCLWALSQGETRVDNQAPREPFCTYEVDRNTGLIPDSHSTYSSEGGKAHNKAVEAMCRYCAHAQRAGFAESFNAFYGGKSEPSAANYVCMNCSKRRLFPHLLDSVRTTLSPIYSQGCLSDTSLPQQPAAEHAAQTSAEHVAQTSAEHAAQTAAHTVAHTAAQTATHTVAHIVAHTAAQTTALTAVRTSAESTAQTVPDDTAHCQRCVPDSHPSGKKCFGPAGQPPNRKGRECPLHSGAGRPSRGLNTSRNKLERRSLTPQMRTTRMTRPASAARSDGRDVVISQEKLRREYFWHGIRNFPTSSLPSQVYRQFKQLPPRPRLPWLQGVKSRYLDYATQRDLSNPFLVPRSVIPPARRALTDLQIQTEVTKIWRSKLSTGKASLSDRTYSLSAGSQVHSTLSRCAVRSLRNWKKRASDTFGGYHSHILSNPFPFRCTTSPADRDHPAVITIPKFGDAPRISRVPVNAVEKMSFRNVDSEITACFSPWPDSSGSSSSQTCIDRTQKVAMTIRADDALTEKRPHHQSGDRIFSAAEPKICICGRATSPTFSLSSGSGKPCHRHLSEDHTYCRHIDNSQIVRPKDLFKNNCSLSLSLVCHENIEPDRTLPLRSLSPSPICHFSIASSTEDVRDVSKPKDNTSADDEGEVDMSGDTKATPLSSGVKFSVEVDAKRSVDSSDRQRSCVNRQSKEQIYSEELKDTCTVPARNSELKLVDPDKAAAYLPSPVDAGKQSSSDSRRLSEETKAGFQRLGSSFSISSPGSKLGDAGTSDNSTKDEGKPRGRALLKRKMKPSFIKGLKLKLMIFSYFNPRDTTAVRCNERREPQDMVLPTLSRALIQGFTSDSATECADENRQGDMAASGELDLIKELGLVGGLQVNRCECFSGIPEISLPDQRKSTLTSLLSEGSCRPEGSGADENARDTSVIERLDLGKEQCLAGELQHFRSERFHDGSKIGQAALRSSTATSLLSSRSEKTTVEKKSRDTSAVIQDTRPETSFVRELQVLRSECFDRSFLVSQPAPWNSTVTIEDSNSTFRSNKRSIGDEMTRNLSAVIQELDIGKEADLTDVLQVTQSECYDDSFKISQPAVRRSSSQLSCGSYRLEQSRAEAKAREDSVVTQELDKRKEPTLCGELKILRSECLKDACRISQPALRRSPNNSQLFDSSCRLEKSGSEAKARDQSAVIKDLYTRKEAGSGSECQVIESECSDDSSKSCAPALQRSTLSRQNSVDDSCQSEKSGAKAKARGTCVVIEELHLRKEPGLAGEIQDFQSEGFDDRSEISQPAPQRSIVTIQDSDSSCQSKGSEGEKKIRNTSVVIEELDSLNEASLVGKLEVLQSERFDDSSKVSRPAAQRSTVVTCQDSDRIYRSKGSEGDKKARDTCAVIKNLGKDFNLADELQGFRPEPLHGSCKISQPVSWTSTFSSSISDGRSEKSRAPDNSRDGSAVIQTQYSCGSRTDLSFVNEMQILPSEGFDSSFKISRPAVQRSTVNFRDSYSSCRSKVLLNDERIRDTSAVIAKYDLRKEAGLSGQLQGFRSEPLDGSCKVSQVASQTSTVSSIISDGRSENLSAPVNSRYASSAIEELDTRTEASSFDEMQVFPSERFNSSSKIGQPSLQRSTNTSKESEDSYRSTAVISGAGENARDIPVVIGKLDSRKEPGVAGALINFQSKIGGSKISKPVPKRFENRSGSFVITDECCGDVDSAEIDEGKTRFVSEGQVSQPTESSTITSQTLKKTAVFNVACLESRINEPTVQRFRPVEAAFASTQCEYDIDGGNFKGDEGNEILVGGEVSLPEKKGRMRYSPTLLTNEADVPASRSWQTKGTASPKGYETKENDWKDISAGVRNVKTTSTQSTPGALNMMSIEKAIRSAMRAIETVRSTTALPEPIAELSPNCEDSGVHVGSQTNSPHSPIFHVMSSVSAEQNVMSVNFPMEYERLYASKFMSPTGSNSTPLSPADLKSTAPYSLDRTVPSPLKTDFDAVGLLSTNGCTPCVFPPSNTVINTSLPSRTQSTSSHFLWGEVDDVDSFAYKDSPQSSSFGLGSFSFCSGERSVRSQQTLFQSYEGEMDSSDFLGILADTAKVDESVGPPYHGARVFWPPHVLPRLSENDAEGKDSNSSRTQTLSAEQGSASIQGVGCNIQSKQGAPRFSEGIVEDGDLFCSKPDVFSVGRDSTTSSFKIESVPEGTDVDQSTEVVDNASESVAIDRVNECGISVDGTPLAVATVETINCNPKSLNIDLKATVISEPILTTPDRRTFKGGQVETCRTSESASRNVSAVLSETWSRRADTSSGKTCCVCPVSIPKGIIKADPNKKIVYTHFPIKTYTLTDNMRCIPKRKNMIVFYEVSKVGKTKRDNSSATMSGHHFTQHVSKSTEKDSCFLPTIGSPPPCPAAPSPTTKNADTPAASASKADAKDRTASALKVGSCPIQPVESRLPEKGGLPCLGNEQPSQVAIAAGQGSCVVTKRRVDKLKSRQRLKSSLFLTSPGIHSSEKDSDDGHKRSSRKSELHPRSDLRDEAPHPGDRPCEAGAVRLHRSRKLLNEDQVSLGENTTRLSETCRRGNNLPSRNDRSCSCNLTKHLHVRPLFPSQPTCGPNCQYNSLLVSRISAQSVDDNCKAHVDPESKRGNAGSIVSKKSLFLSKSKQTCVGAEYSSCSSPSSGGSVKETPDRGKPDVVNWRKSHPTKESLEVRTVENPARRSASPLKESKVHVSATWDENNGRIRVKHVPVSSTRVDGIADLSEVYSDRHVHTPDDSRSSKRYRRDVSRSRDSSLFDKQTQRTSCPKEEVQVCPTSRTSRISAQEDARTGNRSRLHTSPRGRSPSESSTDKESSTSARNKDV